MLLRRSLCFCGNFTFRSLANNFKGRSKSTSSEMEGVDAIKNALRKDIKNKLSALTVEEAERQSKRVHEMLFQLPAFQDSQRISVYLSTENEISTCEIVKRIFDDGKLCFIPRCTANDMEMVKLESMDDWENLPLNKRKIKEPLLSEKRQNALETGGLDLIITPGLAFNEKGDRLGHGGGYYDMYFTKLAKVQKRPVLTVALAYKEQIIENIPVDPRYDIKVDCVLYDDD